MFFSRRRRSRRDRLLPVKVATLVIGGVMGLIGMRVENTLVVGAATVVVLVGFLLRFVPQPRDPDQPDPASPGGTPPEG